ncbi:hypothetical protein G9A89_009524 [Geosiphon pyriformis]|nr:hypothetical protein G9A89_009524 [Geosiphon pyriformis]
MAKTKARQRQPPVPASPPEKKLASRPQRPKFEKPDQSWLQILIKAFKHNYEATLTYKESELFSWICQTYPYYATHNAEFWHASCFRNVGRNVWTYIDQKAAEILKQQEEEAEENEEDEDQIGGEESSESSVQEKEEEEPAKIIKPRLRKSMRPIKRRSPPPQSSSFTKTVKHKRYPRKSHSVDLQESDVHMSSSSSPPTPPPEKEEELGEVIPQKQENESDQESDFDNVRVESPEEVAQFVFSEASTSDGENTRIIKYRRMSSEAWLKILIKILKSTKKQKTIRELSTMIKETYPIFENAPSIWESDFTMVLESNPQFQNMGRGRWCIAKHDDEIFPNEGTDVEYREGSDGSSSTEEEDWRSLGPQKLISSKRRRHSVAGPIRKKISTSIKGRSHRKTKSVSYRTEAPNINAITSEFFVNPSIHKIPEVPMTPDTPNLRPNLQIGPKELFSSNQTDPLSPITPTPLRRYEFITEMIRSTSPTPTKPKPRTPKVTPPPPPPPNYTDEMDEGDFDIRYLSHDECTIRIENSHKFNQFPFNQDYTHQQHMISQDSQTSPLHSSSRHSPTLITLASIPVIPDERAAIEALTLLCRTEASPL